MCDEMEYGDIDIELDLEYSWWDCLLVFGRSNLKTFWIFGSFHWYFLECFNFWCYGMKMML